MNLTVRIEDGEYWWGGSSADAQYQPFTAESEYALDMYHGYNQIMPLFLSSKGRYVWCEKPMQVHISSGEISLSAESEILVRKVGETLRDAYLAASYAHFRFSGKIPPQKFFTAAQYNTWMVMDYNQTQEGVLRYAHDLIDHGYEPGVLMIDEGWHTRYGLWEFDKSKFPDPKAMIDELHALGFAVMLWVVPLVTADGRDYIMAAGTWRNGDNGEDAEKQYFLRTDDGQVAIVRWWNGNSAILNMLNPADREFLDSKLQALIKNYGVDGFKFDGGNIHMYRPGNVINGKQTKYSADDMNIAWNEFGTRYEYHEYKDTFKGGGKAVIQRLRDRDHTWNENGLTSILPAALVQGLIGHPFICPDMVGGGEWSFNYLPGFKCDEELFVRMAQCSALFPMMQFSWEPWRKLDEKHSRLCLEAAMLHKKFAGRILDLVKESALSGEPILRNMEYEYPHKGYETVTDQFLLGPDMLVAPVVKQGQTARSVILPEGIWIYCDGAEYTGGQTVTVPAPIDVLPYFVRAK